MLLTFIVDMTLCMVGVATIWLCFEHDKLKKSLETLLERHKNLKERFEDVRSNLYSRMTAVENDCQNAIIRESELQVHYSDLRQDVEDLKPKPSYAPVQQYKAPVVGTATITETKSKKKAAKRKK